MKFKMILKFLGEPEKTFELDAWEPMRFIGMFAYEMSRQPTNGYLKWPLLDYFRIERVEK